MSNAGNKRAHRNQLFLFFQDYLAHGAKHGSSAEYIKNRGLESVREDYPLVRIIDLVAIDEFVEKTNLK